MEKNLSVGPLAERERERNRSSEERRAFEASALAGTVHERVREGSIASDVGRGIWRTGTGENELDIGGARKLALAGSYPMVAGYVAESERLKGEQRERARGRERREQDRWGRKDTNPIWSDSDHTDSVLREDDTMASRDGSGLEDAGMVVQQGFGDARAWRVATRPAWSDTDGSGEVGLIAGSGYEAVGQRVLSPSPSLSSKDLRNDEELVSGYLIGTASEEKGRLFKERGFKRRSEEEEANALRESLRALDGMNKALQAEVSELAGDKAALEHDKQGLQTLSEGLQRDKQQLERELGRARAQIAALQDPSSSLGVFSREQERATTSASISASVRVATAAASLHKELEMQLEQEREHVRALGASMEALEQRNEHLLQQQREGQIKLVKADAQRKELAERNLELEGEVRDVRARLDESAAALTAARLDTAKLARCNNDEVAAKNVELQEAEMRMRGEVEICKEADRNRERERAAERKKIADMAAEIGSLRGEVSAERERRVKEVEEERREGEAKVLRERLENERERGRALEARDREKEQQADEWARERAELARQSEAREREWAVEREVREKERETWERERDKQRLEWEQEREIEQGAKVQLQESQDSLKAAVKSANADLKRQLEVMRLSEKQYLVQIQALEEAVGTLRKELQDQLDRSRELDKAHQDAHESAGDVRAQVGELKMEIAALKSEKASE